MKQHDKTLPKGVTVQELIGLVPDSLIEDLAGQLVVDKWVRKLKGGYLFKLVLFSILSSERLSLRIMESNFEDPFFRALAPAVAADEVTWTGIRERLMKVKGLFFRKLYEAVYERARELYGGKGLSRYHIKSYDSTMVATFSHLLEGMKVGNTKKGKTQVKLTTEFTEGFLIRMDFHKGQAYLSEETALKEGVRGAARGKGDVHVFDKGMKGRATFEEFEGEGTLFVTRLAENARYDVIRPHGPDDGFQDSAELELMEDSVVRLYRSGPNSPCENGFRLVRYHVKGEGKMLLFVTNVWDVEPSAIAHIYKQRWDIEVLFRFMKQEMNLSHFVCNDTNAIQAMLYCTMIAAMLVLIFKKLNGIKSYKKAKIRFFKELLYLILFEAMEDPGELERLKSMLKKYVQRE